MADHRRNNELSNNLDKLLEEIKAKSAPQAQYNPQRVRTPSQFERDFDQRMQAEQLARQNAVKRGVSSWVPEIPGFAADLLVDAPYNLVQRAAGKRGDNIKPLGFGEDVRRGVSQALRMAPASLREAGMSMPPDETNAAVTTALQLANPLMWGAAGNPMAIARATGKGALTAARAGEQFAEKTVPKIMERGGIGAEMLGALGQNTQSSAVKLGGGNWPANSVEYSMKRLKTRPTWVSIEDIADARAQGLGTTVMERELANLKPALAVNNWVDKQLVRYVKNEMATPKDSIRIAADAFPATKTKLLEAKQAQLDKAVAARDKLQVERNVAPEILTRSNARIRELETEKRLIEYRKGLHGGEFEEYANVNPFAELTPADMFDTNLASRRADAGMPAEGFGKTPMGKAWENATDEEIITTPAGDTRGSAGKSFGKLPPDTPTYDLVGGVDDVTDTLGFSHLVDEIRNAVSFDSTLPAQFRIDAKDLSKWTVPQMSEHVDKINAWRKVQSEDALNAAREGIPVHKAYPEGYQWLAVPDLETSPEALKYATEVGCQGGWCTAGADTATRYGSGNNRLYVLHNPSGNAVAQINTKPNIVDPIAAKYAKLEQSIREEIRADAMAHNPHVDKRLWEPIRPGTLKDAELAMRDTQLSAATLRRFPELAEQIKLKRIAEIKGLQNQMPSPEDLPFIQDFVRSQQWSDVGDLHHTGLIKGVKGSSVIRDGPHRYDVAMPELPYYTRRELADHFESQGVPTLAAKQQAGDVEGMTELLTRPPAEGMKRGGPVNQDAMQMAVWNKALRKQVGGEPTQAEIDAATLPARMNPNLQRQAEKIKSQGERDFPIMGPLELGSQVLSGTAAMLPATMYGIFKDLSSRKPGDPYSGQAAGNQAVKDALEMLTYQPRTAPGQDWSREFGQIMETSKLPPYFGHLGTPHVVPGVGRLLMENATAPGDPFFAGQLGRQRGAVKPQGNLNLQPNIAVETLKGPEVQTLESFINQSKSMPGVTKEGFGEGLGAAQSITPSSKMSKSDFEKYVAPSKYEKVTLADDSGDINEHFMNEAYADAGTRIDEQMAEVGVPTNLRDAFRDLYRDYAENPDALLESPVSYLTENVPLRNWLTQRGYRTGIDIHQEMDDARNVVADRLYRDTVLEDGEQEGTLPPFFDVQRLVDGDDYSSVPYTYEAVGVLHPSERGVYGHFPGVPNMVGHFRGSLMHEVVEAEGGVKIPRNAFLVEEVQSDSQQNKAMSGHLHQIHATVAKAAIQHALEMGADSVYFPSSIPISEVRTGSEKTQKLFRRVYDTEVMKGAIDPLRKMKGVTVTGIGKVIGDDNDPKFLYTEVKFSPEAKEQILKGKGQLAPGYKQGGVVEGEPTQAEIDAAMLPARMNSSISAQGDAYRANMAAPTSIMDPRYPAWKKNQNAADAVGVVSDLALSAIPLVGPAARGVMSASKALAPTAAKFAEDYMLRTGMQLYAKPVDLSRRGFLGLPKASTSTENALVPANTSITSAPIASELTSISPLEYLTQKIADTPMSRRDFLEQTAKTAASQALKGTLPNVVQNALKDIGAHSIGISDDIAAKKIAEYAAKAFKNSTTDQALTHMATIADETQALRDNDLLSASFWKRHFNALEPKDNLDAAKLLKLDIASTAKATNLPVETVKKLFGNDAALIDEYIAHVDPRWELATILEDGRAKEAIRMTSLDALHPNKYVNKAMSALGRDADFREILDEAFNNLRTDFIAKERAKLTSTPHMQEVSTKLMPIEKYDAILEQAQIEEKMADYIEKKLQSRGYAKGGVVTLGQGLDMRGTGEGLAPYGLRHGTPTAKAKGYFGLLPAADGKVSSEISAESDVGEHPLMVPTLNKEELNLLLSGQRPTDAIYQKAEDWAKKRQDSGQSPFASGNDYRYPVPKRKGGSISQDAMHMAVWNKQLRKQHG